MFSLSGRRALVTGGGRGLGAGIAAGLVSAGASVALVSRSERELADIASELGELAVAVPGDVNDPSLTDRVEERLNGPIDIVVHAAGIQHRQPAEDFDEDAWNRVLGVNLTAPFRLSRKIGNRQLASGRPGSHVFVGSLASRLSVPGAIAYTASKSGLYGVVRGLSTEWSGRGVRVNGIGPGYFRTELTKALVDDPLRGPKLLERIPMHRLGAAGELAGAAVFLASDASSYVTGQLLMVDGGWTAA